MLSMAAASAATTITIPSRRDRRVEDHRLALRHELVYAYGAEREGGFYRHEVGRVNYFKSWVFWPRGRA